MLVGGGMENDCRLVVCEYVIDSNPVRHVHKQWLNGQEWKRLAQFAVDVKEAVFRLVQEKKFLRFCSCNLPREFRSDAASGSCDEHDPAFDDFGYFPGIRLNFGPLQQVLYVQTPNIMCGNVAIDKFRESGQSAHRQPRLAANRKQAAHLGRCRTGDAD